MNEPLLDASSADATRTSEQSRITRSPGFPKILESLNACLAFSSYQSRCLYFLSPKRKGAGLFVNVVPSGISLGLHLTSDGSLYNATATSLIRYENQLSAGATTSDGHDHLFVPREVQILGPLQAHDVALVDDEGVCFVNTAFNCIARPDRVKSFAEVWRPKFVSRLIKEDRCHLNGMAVHNGTLRYATAIGPSDTIDGWRDHRAGGGVVLDCPSGEIYATGLSMPHSPRVNSGKLWVCNSGTGEIGFIDEVTQKFEPVVFCPGYVRGLAFTRQYAIVGLSRPRYDRFVGLPLDDRLAQTGSTPWTGIQVIDLASGTCVEWLRIDGAIEEIFDVVMIPDAQSVSCLSALPQDTTKIVTF